MKEACGRDTSAPAGSKITKADRKGDTDISFSNLFVLLSLVYLYKLNNITI